MKFNPIARWSALLLAGLLRGCEECPAQPVPVGIGVADEARWAALSMQESGDDDRAVGPQGEVSRFQIRPAVWRRYSGLPLGAATNPFTARQVAQSILLDRSRRLPPGSRLDDFNWVMLWKAPAFVLDRRLCQHRPGLWAQKKAQADCAVNLIGKFK